MPIADVRDPPAAIGGRASWTGQLELGPLKLPVKAYPALVMPTNGPLHQIHIACGRRISQRKFCSEHGELAGEAIGKAFELSPEESIPLTANELTSLSPEGDSSIRIEHLLPLEKIDLSLLSGRMLFLAPTQPAVELLYARAVAALDRLRHWGVGRMVLSDTRRLVAVGNDGARLLLLVLHWPEYRRACPASDVDTSSVPAAEVRSLEKALAPLLKSFAWDEYRDEGADRLNQLIAAKLADRSAKPQRGRTGASSRTSRARVAA